MDVLPLIIIFGAGLVGGAFGTLVGGNSLITIPLLILMGLPPHLAIGTDRLGATGIGVAGLYSFHRKGMMRYRLAFILGIPCLLGSFIGAYLALQISPALLKQFIVLLTVVLLVFVVVNPGLGVVVTKRPLTAGRQVLGAVLSLAVGIYGGFYGGGASTFLTYILLFVYHQTFLESAANVKVASIMMTVTAAVTYACHGAIHLSLGVAMFSGAFIGSCVGVHYSDRIGNVWIKRLFIGVILIMVVKLIIDA
jgi:hypothetical protein